jgi:hypothetical protein
MRPCEDQRDKSEAARFAAYTAALDQEQSAAAPYAEWLGVLDRRRPDSN